MSHPPCLHTCFPHSARLLAAWHTEEEQSLHCWSRLHTPGKPHFLGSSLPSARRSLVSAFHREVPSLPLTHRLPRSATPAPQEGGTSSTQQPHCHCFPGVFFFSNLETQNRRGQSQFASTFCFTMTLIDLDILGAKTRGGRLLLRCSTRPSPLPLTFSEIRSQHPSPPLTPQKVCGCPVDLPGSSFSAMPPSASPALCELLLEHTAFLQALSMASAGCWWRLMGTRRTQGLG